MTNDNYKHWNITRSVELGATAKEVWAVVGGFFTIHQWHPDIAETEVPPEQVETHAIRRILTFPEQPKTVEEQVFVNNADYHYCYKWHAGQWGEIVKNYHASIRVMDTDSDRRCVMQWACSFDHPEDAITEFYENGFRALREMFPL